MARMIREELACLHSDDACRACRASWAYCNNGCGRVLDSKGQEFCSYQCENEYYDPSRRSNS